MNGRAWLVLSQLVVVLVGSGVATACLTDAECDQCAGELCFKNASVTEGICSSQGRSPINCDDGNACTIDTCSSTTAQCTHEGISFCCTSDADCNACTGTGCRLDSNSCGATSAPLDCDDHDVCTADSCNVAGGCGHDAIAGCCHTDDACADDDACTIDTCGSDATCAHEPQTKIAAILCLCGTPPASCTGVKLPHRIERRFTRGCSMAANAEVRKGARKRRLLGRAAHLFRRAAVSAARAPRTSIPLACRLDLGTVLGAAQGRAKALHNN